jgi:hypothetical protein
MPAKSEKQRRFMAAVANNPKFAKKVGVPTSVGEEFMKKPSDKRVKKYQAGGDLRLGTPNGAGPSAPMMPQSELGMAAQTLGGPPGMDGRTGLMLTETPYFRKGGKVEKSKHYKHGEKMKKSKGYMGGGMMKRYAEGDMVEMEMEMPMGRAEEIRRGIPNQGGMDTIGRSDAADLPKKVAPPTDRKKKSMMPKGPKKDMRKSMKKGGSVDAESFMNSYKDWAKKKADVKKSVGAYQKGGSVRGCGMARGGRPCKMVKMKGA